MAKHETKIKRMDLGALFKEIEEAKKDPKFMSALNEFIKKTSQ